MKQMVLKIAVIATLLLHVLLTTDQPAAIAHDRAAPHNPSDTVVFPAMLPGRARQLLTSIAPLSMAQQESKDVNIKSSLLCFCLHKAGETIRELRGLQAEWFDKGRASFAAQHYTDALTAFNRVIDMNLRDARVYTNRGLSHAHLGDYPQALQDFTRAIALNHHQAEAYYARGLLAFIVDDAPAAHRDLQTAAQLNYAPAQQLLRPTHLP